MVTDHPLFLDTTAFKGHILKDDLYLRTVEAVLLRVRLNGHSVSEPGLRRSLRWGRGVGKRVGAQRTEHSFPLGWGRGEGKRGRDTHGRTSLTAKFCTDGAEVYPCAL